MPADVLGQNLLQVQPALRSVRTVALHAELPDHRAHRARYRLPAAAALAAQDSSPVSTQFSQRFMAQG